MITLWMRGALVYGSSTFKDAGQLELPSRVATTTHLAMGARAGLEPAAEEARVNVWSIWCRARGLSFER